MNLDFLERASDQINTFSLIQGLPSENGELPAGSIDFHEILLRLASTLRRKELGYRIRYVRPDQPDFRLRSQRTLSQSTRKHTLSFSDPGRALTLRVEDPGEEVFRGLLSELQILGEMEDTGNDTVREPELNLLVSRTFQAELYAEYQRWKRYDAGFLVVALALEEDVDWRPGGRSLKHVARSRDCIGYLHEHRLAGFFRSPTDPDGLREDLEQRVSSHYQTSEANLIFTLVPDDIDDWSTLKERILNPIITEEPTGPEPNRTRSD